MSTAEITIRSIQHYLYCPHRWGLLEIDKAWEENFFVTKANLIHDRVHNPEQHYNAKGKKVFTAVPVYHDQEEYNLYGVVDCLEIAEDKRGMPIKNYEGNYKFCIVEYKPTKPKEGDYRADDLMQVFAQKLCVDYIFGCDCDANIYYADVKKRIKLPLKNNFFEYDCRLKILLKEMREYLRLGIVPPIRKGQKCSGCSMKDLCMPSVKRMNTLLSEIEAIDKSWLNTQ